MEIFLVCVPRRIRSSQNCAVWGTDSVFWVENSEYAWEGTVSWEVGTSLSVAAGASCPAKVRVGTPVPLRRGSVEVGPKSEPEAPVPNGPTPVPVPDSAG